MSKIVVAAKQKSALNALDVCFDMDATGSMQPWIDRVRDVVTDIANDIVNSGTRPDLRLALVEYRDHESGRSKDQPTNSGGFRHDAAQFFGDLRAVRCSGGGDGPEAVADGLVTALELPWRPSAQKAVVLVGDAPPHGVGAPGDSYPGGCPCGSTLEGVAQRMKKAGIVIHAIAVTDDSRTASSFRTLADTTGGLFASLTDARRLGALLASIAREEGRKISDDIVVAARFDAARGDVTRLADMTGLAYDDVHESLDRLRAKEAIVSVDGAHSESSTRPRPSRVRIIR